MQNSPGSLPTLQTILIRAFYFILAKVYRLGEYPSSLRYNYNKFI